LAAGTVTLLYGARDERHNNAVALLGWLDKKKEFFFGKKEPKNF
jgi:hypothetical protein